MVRTLTAAIVVTALVAMAIPAAAQGLPTKMTLTIPEAIELAWRNNINSLNAQNAVSDAKASKLGGRSVYLPRLSLSASWDRSYPKQQINFGSSIFASQDSYGYRFSLSQPLFDGFRYIYAPRWETANVSRSEARLRSTRQRITSETKSFCYDLLKAQMLADVRQKSVKQAQEQLQTSQARYELGSASLSDFLKAKVRLGNDSLSLIVAENDIMVRRARLNDYLGLPVNRATEIDAQMNLEAYQIPSTQEQLAAVNDHPDVQDAMRSVDMASANIGSARSNRYPYVSANASYSYNTSQFPDGFDEIAANDRAAIGISINYTIFSGFSTTSQIRRAKVSKHTAENQLAQAKRTVALAVTTAALKVEEARRRYEVTIEQVRSAEEDFNIAQEKYNLGAATILDVLDAQVSLSDAETKKIEAIFDFSLAVAQLEKAMGKGD